MPSQRLLKLLDPRGGLPVLASTGPRALVWASPNTRSWIVDELGDTRVRPLLAVSLRHLATSLRSNAEPRADVAIIQISQLTADEIDVLVAARWLGYRGPLIAIADGPVETKFRTLFGITDVVRTSTAGALHAAVNRLLAS